MFRYCHLDIQLRELTMTLNRYKLLLSTFTLLFSFSGLAQSLPSDNSGEVYYQQCIACHGDKAQGNEALKAPALAGQFNWYLSRQLTNFTNKTRGDHKKDVQGQQMAAIVGSADFSQKITALSDYISALPSTKLSQKVDNVSNEVLKNGSRYYQGKCGACHGGKAQCNEAFNAPKLSGLSKAYLAQQMTNFSSGLRGTHQSDKFGRQMAMMAKTTSGNELSDIITYISHQAED